MRPRVEAHIVCGIGMRPRVKAPAVGCSYWDASQDRGPLQHQFWGFVPWSRPTMSAVLG